MKATLQLCAQSELLEGCARGFPEHGIFIVRHTGQVYAWRDACPHYGDTPLAWRRDAYLNVDGTRIVCAAHGAQFEPDTGLCIIGPCLGQALIRVPIVLTDKGQIELESGTQPNIDPDAFQENH